MNLKRRILALALIPTLGVPLSACEPADTCAAIALSITGADAGGKGGGKGGGKSGKSGKSKSGSGKSKTTTNGGHGSGDDCDD